MLIDGAFDDLAELFECLFVSLLDSSLIALVDRVTLFKGIDGPLESALAVTLLNFVVFLLRIHMEFLGLALDGRPLHLPDTGQATSGPFGFNDGFVPLFCRLLA